MSEYVDEFNEDHSGWARFSAERTADGVPVHRYRLARSLDGSAINIYGGRTVVAMDPVRVTFLMLNPSTADAFKHDPTVGECIKRAKAWGASVLEVVNLFALRSPYPADLKKCAIGHRGDSVRNNSSIIQACLGAELVIAAWGNHGSLDSRDLSVLGSLATYSIKLHCLGVTQDGHPKHPLARGKHRIPMNFEPLAWPLRSVT